MQSHVLCEVVRFHHRVFAWTGVGERWVGVSACVPRALTSHQENDFVALAQQRPARPRRRRSRVVLQRSDGGPDSLPRRGAPDVDWSSHVSTRHGICAGVGQSRPFPRKRFSVNACLPLFRIMGGDLICQ